MMKKIFMLSLAALTINFATTALAQAPAPAKDVVLNVIDAYVPGGFDSTSDVFTVVNGIFPNGCYSWSRAEVTHPSQFLHEVRAVASVTQGMCIMVLIPYTKEIHIGRTGAGTHKLRFINGDGTYLEKTLNIEQ